MDTLYTILLNCLLNNSVNRLEGLWCSPNEILSFEKLFYRKRKKKFLKTEYAKTILLQQKIFEFLSQNSVFDSYNFFIW